jgi:hypothetical protein
LHCCYGLLTDKISSFSSLLSSSPGLTNISQQHIVSSTKELYSAFVRADRISIVSHSSNASTLAVMARAPALTSSGHQIVDISFMTDPSFLLDLPKDFSIEDPS